MGVRVAYGQRDNLNSAIENNIVPKDSIIIANNDIDSELLFYDTDGNLISVSERVRFASLDAANSWVKKYKCKGFVITVFDGTKWTPYIIQEDYTLSPIKGGTAEIDIQIIDGGTAEDM